MPWTCFIVANHSLAKKAGAMWEAKESTPEKPIWFVRLPNGQPHNIFGPSSDGTPWNVSGTAPNFTVTPSINMQIAGGDYKDCKGWHGWLTDGVLTDDTEGRTYKEE